ncbi:hypothetical protein [Azospirillum halopraeferens]|uniref:hypothetical protein n=1 Tax=Azospirillum halopraeferens TaxID=34010 RepID=UPI0004119C8A|nr:hypothetical protein [Azospirillum halopraeferens]
MHAVAGLLRPVAVAGALAATLAGHAAGVAVSGDVPVWLPGLAAAALALAGALLSGALAEGEAPVVRAVAAVAAGVLVSAAVPAAAHVSAGTGWMAVATAAALAVHAVSGGRPWLASPAAGTALAGFFLLGTGGVAAEPAVVRVAALVLFSYGAGIAMLACGPSWRGDRRAAYGALGLVASAVLLPLMLGWGGSGYAGLAALPFVLILAWRILPDALWAASDPRPVPARTAAVSGDAAVPALAAALAAGFAGLPGGLLLLALMPVAGVLERLRSDRGERA